MNKTFIIAEGGVNHNGSIETAFKLVDSAFHAGADAIKFQTYKSELIASKFAERATYQKNNMPGGTESQLEMIKRYELKIEDFVKIKNYCDNKGILFLTTTADEQSTQQIEHLIPAFKIGSADLTNIPFLKYLASKNKPVILSTGMANLGEIEEAVNLFDRKRNNEKLLFPPITLLHCTTNYPCPFEEVNLNAMLTLKKTFNLPVGYSDHTQGIEVPIAAAALGASVIEKHFTLDKNMEGPDHKASLEPTELKNMVVAIRNIENSMGTGLKHPNKSETEIINVARKSVVALKDIAAGTILSTKMLSVKRPGNGIKPADIEKIVGLKINKSKKEDETIFWSDFK